MENQTLKTTSDNAAAQVQASWKFEWTYIVLSTWFLAGIYWDAWSHTHVPELESFFTPAHLLMYTGAGALSLFVLYQVFTGIGTGLSWRQALPKGYFISLLGIIIFMTAGVGDLIWHSLFGIEQELEASFSPTHMALMLGLIFLLGGPFFAEWFYPQKRTSFIEYLPIIISTTFLYSGFTVISQWAHPYVAIFATAVNDDISLIQGIGMLSVILQTGFLMGLILLIVKREFLPAGIFTIMLTVNAALLGLMRDHYLFIIGALITGIVADLYLWGFKPSKNNPKYFRIFAVLVPAVMFTMYFLILQFSPLYDLVWNIHMTSGGVVVASGISYLLSFLVLNPIDIEDIGKELHD